MRLFDSLYRPLFNKTILPVRQANRGGGVWGPMMLISNLVLLLDEPAGGKVRVRPRGLVPLERKT